jgi:hypothetical protein
MPLADKKYDFNPAENKAVWLNRIPHERLVPKN